MVNDSILEENDPIQLDLEKRQLFMDTTRNSIFLKSKEKGSHTDLISVQFIIT